MLLQADEVRRDMIERFPSWVAALALFGRLALQSQRWQSPIKYNSMPNSSPYTSVVMSGSWNLGRWASCPRASRERTQALGVGFFLWVRVDFGLLQISTRMA